MAAAADMQAVEREELRREIHAVQEGLELGGNATSTSATIDVEARNGAVEMSMEETKKKMKKKKLKAFEVLSFWRLFHCADTLDYLLMFMGTLGAIVNGLTLPVMIIIQGRLINTFGNLQNQPDLIYEHLKKVG